MPAFANDEVFKTFMKVLPDIQFVSFTLDWEEITELTVDALQRIYLGDAEIKSTLDEAAAKINSILDRQ